MNSPLISVIIPAYNAEKFIEETLQSVLDQTYQNWECIIVNDGSTDSTEQIAKNWCSKDNRFRYFYKENSGVSATRNMGIEKAQGEYIAFLDADDAFLPEKLEKQLEILQKENVDFVFSNFQDTYTKKINTGYILIKENTLLYGKEGIECFLLANPVNTSTVFCKKEVLIKTNGFTFDKYAEDFHLWLRILLLGYKMYYTTLPLALYRLHSNSLSNSNRYCLFEVLEIMLIFKDDIENHKINFEKFFIKFYEKHYAIWAKKHITQWGSYRKVLKGVKQRMKEINSIRPNYFPSYVMALSINDKIAKLLALQVIKRKNK